MAELAALEPLAGEWRLEASLAPGVIGGATFEWALEGAFLVQRSSIPVEGAPEGLSVIALDDDGQGFTMHYFDSRGVVRLYAMNIEDGLWTLVRDKPDFTPLSFSQRFTGRFGDDGNTIAGRWEKNSGAGTEFELDFELNYPRVR
jgi:hypothetical protein